MPSANAPRQPVQLIRLGLLAGVLLFGVVIVFVHRQPNWTPGTLPSALGYALLAYAIAIIPIAMALRPRIMREADPGRRATLLLIGWAVGEAAGLVGAVIFYVTGQGQGYLLGLLAMVCVRAAAGAVIVAMTIKGLCSGVRPLSNASLHA